MRMPIRLRDRDTQTRYVVDLAGGKVYSDRKEQGAISQANQVHGALADRVLASAREYCDFFDVVPGNMTPDGKLEVRGSLTRGEHDAFASGRTVASERPALLLHLDFFDGDLDGRITLAENYAGWRRLGLPWLAASFKALTSSLLFGSIKAGLAIELDRLDGMRYASVTRVYDAAGRIDQAKLDAYLAAFDAAGRPLGFGEVIELLDRSSATGFVSRSQFKSLFQVCERLNKGSKVITRSQFRGLFDGSLLWLAASTPDNAGRRAQAFPTSTQGARGWSARGART